MNQIRRWQRNLILALLSISVIAPIIFVSNRLKVFTSIGRRDVTEFPTTKFGADNIRLNAIEQEAGEGVKVPKLDVYKDEDFGSLVSYRASTEGDTEQSQNAVDTNRLENNVTNDERKEENKQIKQKTDQTNQAAARRGLNVQTSLSRVSDEKIKEMKDQVVRANAYLNFVPSASNSHLVKELKLRIKEVERTVGVATKDSDLSKRALQRMKAMEATLDKASRVYPDCSAMVTKLRAMAYNAEERVRLQKNQPEERQLPNQQMLHNPDLYHYAVFSDNVLACAVVVNSTIFFAMEPEKIVFHVVTDSLNLPAISMWFLLNPPGKATIQVQSIDQFKWLSNKYNATLKKENSHDPRFTSPLNHLRFYLPDVFPELNKVLFFDHDVFVQSDLGRLWNIDMKGKVVGAVETCKEAEASFRRMDMFINFSNPLVIKKFDVKACTWAFGVNLFDLQEWRKRKLTAVYHKYLKLGDKRPLWKAGSLPLGWITFYNHTLALDRRWHLLGLGYDSGIPQRDIEQAAVIHYDGVMKPWFEIGIARYKGYWSKFVKYDHPFLQRCNIHQ